MSVTPAPLDRRERILQRLEAVCKSLRGSATVIPTWDGSPSPREIVTDLGGRVFNRMREGDRGRDELPAVEILNDGGNTDTLEVLGQELYRATMPVQVYGYAASREENAKTSSGVRGPLDSLRADLVTAIEALPWWTGVDVDQQDPLSRHGATSVRILRQWTEPDLSQATGYLVIDLEVSYIFTTGNP